MDSTVEEIVWWITRIAFEGVLVFMGSTGAGLFLIPCIGVAIGWYRSDPRWSMKALWAALINGLGAVIICFVLVFSWKFIQASRIFLHPQMSCIPVVAPIHTDYAVAKPNQTATPNDRSHIHILGSIVQNPFEANKPLLVQEKIVNDGKLPALAEFHYLIATQYLVNENDEKQQADTEEAYWRKAKELFRDKKKMSFEIPPNSPIGATGRTDSPIEQIFVNCIQENRCSIYMMGIFKYKERGSRITRISEFCEVSTGLAFSVCHSHNSEP